MANKKENNSKENNKEIDATKVYKIKRSKPNTKKRKNIKTVLIVILLTILILAGVAFGILYGIMRDAKLDVADLAIKYENSVVKDKAGNTIAVLSGEENRDFISISEMPEYLPNAFISIEDERFYEHMGVDIKRTAKATLTYIFNGGKSSFGGSTITQQVVKNSTREDERTWKRKVKEIARAYYLEKELSKDQVLELYLNLIFMGGTSYGVEVASNYYFSKSASELDLAECAFLAGINHSPNSYNPFVENNGEVLQNIKIRTKTVLDKMKELGKIKTVEEYDAAIAKVDAGLTFTKGTIVETVYSYHTDAAIMQIINQLMEEKDLNYEAAKLYLYGGGYTIYTTQDTAIQNAMTEESLKEKYINTANGQQSQASMTLIDHKTGHVVGVIGGLGAKSSLGWNRATQDTKQTGSAMKPLAVVAPGINKGIMTAATVYDDVPYSIYKNYGNYRGLITIRYAIESSQNIPMVKAMQTVGTENAIEFLKSVGITNLVDADNNLGLALGGLTNGTNTLQMAAAYGAIANDGVYIEPTFYTKVVDGSGNTVLEPHQEQRTVMSKAAAYVVKEVLTQPVKTGTASYCGISGISVAAKTGTTNDDYDRWMCGFTPYYSAATWYGYDENRTVSGWSGRNPAGLIFSAVLHSVHEGLKGEKFSDTKPDGVVTATICRDSGLLVTEECKKDERGNRAYTEYFVKGTAPTKKCDCHVKVEICKETKLLANEFCEEKEEKIFITRKDAKTTKAWKSAVDAKYMLIEDTCEVHKEKPDKEKPVITLKGNSAITIKLNGAYKEEGATAKDNKDGDLTDKIKITGKVDTKKEGTYTITYTVEDAAKNVSTVKRTVKVEKEKTNNNENTKPGNTVTNTTGNTNTKPEDTATNTTGNTNTKPENTVTDTDKNSTTNANNTTNKTNPASAEPTTSESENTTIQQ